jgi:hypothetical protein
MEKVTIPRKLVGELLSLHDESVCVKAAFGARMAGIITGDLSLELNGRGSSKTFDRIVEEILMPLCYDVALHMVALGVVPVRLVRASVLARHDQSRKRRYGDLGSDHVDELVPVIPHYTTYTWHVRLNKSGVVENIFESDEKYTGKIWAIR